MCKLALIISSLLTASLISFESLASECDKRIANFCSPRANQGIESLESCVERLSVEKELTCTQLAGEGFGGIAFLFPGKVDEKRRSNPLTMAGERDPRPRGELALSMFRLFKIQQNYLYQLRQWTENLPKLLGLPGNTIMILLALGLAYYVQLCLAWLSLFKKLGVPGNVALVPWYSTALYFSFAGLSPWYFVGFLVPGLNLVVLTLCNLRILPRLGLSPLDAWVTTCLPVYLCLRLSKKAKSESSEGGQPELHSTQAEQPAPHPPRPKLRRIQ